MAEIAGLALGAVGIVGLVGAFKDTLELIDLIADTGNLGRELQLLITKLDIEKTLLLRWADAFGLTSRNYDKRLD